MNGLKGSGACVESALYPGVFLVVGKAGPGKSEYVARQAQGVCLHKSPADFVVCPTCQARITIIRAGGVL